MTISDEVIEVEYSGNEDQDGNDVKDEKKDQSDIEDEVEQKEKTKLVFKVIRCSLQRDTEIVGQMDPYVVVKIGSQKK